MNPLTFNVNQQLLTKLNNGIHPPMSHCKPHKNYIYTKLGIDNYCIPSTQRENKGKFNDEKIERTWWLIE